MNIDKINFFVNSKYTSNSDNSKVSINIPSGLLKLDANQYFTLSINGFSMFNTFFQLSNSNNKFILLYRNNNNIIFESFIISLTCLGNPNVYNLRDNLNQVLTSSICEVVYDKLTNSFIYYRKKSQTNNYYKMFISPINCGNFLGIGDDEEFEIKTDGSVSNPINVVAHKMLYFSIDGDIQINENNFNNIKKSSFQPSNIIFYKTIDIEKNRLLTYNNDDSNSNFEYILSNTQEISNFDITVFNQDGNVIEDLPDWSMCLQFEKHVKDDTLTILRQIKEYLSYIFMLIGNFIYKPY